MVETNAKHEYPFTIDDHKLLQLSFSDTRRLSALRAKWRLKDLIQQQNKDFPDKLKARATSTLLPGISPNQIKLVTSLWEDLMRCSDMWGNRLVKHLVKKCPKLRTKITVKTDGGITSPVKVQLGRCLIRHISDVIFNLPHAAALESAINAKVDLLKQHGIGKNTIMRCSEAILSFLAESFSAQWTPEVLQATEEVVNKVRELSFWHLKCPKTQNEAFRAHPSTSKNIKRPAIKFTLPNIPG